MLSTYASSESMSFPRAFPFTPTNNLIPSSIPPSVSTSNLSPHSYSCSSFTFVFYFVVCHFIVDFRARFTLLQEYLLFYFSICFLYIIRLLLAASLLSALSSSLPLYSLLLYYPGLCYSVPLRDCLALSSPRSRSSQP